MYATFLLRVVMHATWWEILKFPKVGPHPEDEDHKDITICATVCDYVGGPHWPHWAEGELLAFKIVEDEARSANGLYLYISH